MPITERPVSWRFEIDVPELGDEEARTAASWELPLRMDGDAASEILYDGQLFGFSSSLGVEAEARWSDGDLSVDIGLKVDVISQCSRCLEPAGIEIREDFMYLYSLRKNTKGQRSAEEEEDYRTVRIPCLKSRLDISDQVFESLILSLPSRVLCSPDCPGICPSCGRLLKSGSCGCSAEEIDPRLEGLSLIRTDEDSE